MTMLAILALVEFGSAGWGFLTSIGLLKLKPWARVSALIFCGIVAVSAFFFAPLLLLPTPLWVANGICRRPRIAVEQGMGILACGGARHILFA
jgi:hypothetical protein